MCTFRETCALLHTSALMVMGTLIATCPYTGWWRNYYFDENSLKNFVLFPFKNLIKCSESYQRNKECNIFGKDKFVFLTLRVTACNRRVSCKLSIVVNSWDGDWRVEFQEREREGASVTVVTNLAE